MPLLKDWTVSEEGSPSTGDPEDWPDDMPDDETSAVEAITFNLEASDLDSGLAQGEFHVVSSPGELVARSDGPDAMTVVVRNIGATWLHRVAIPVMIGKDDDGERRRVLRIAFDKNRYLYIDAENRAVLLTDDPDLVP